MYMYTSIAILLRDNRINNEYIIQKISFHYSFIHGE